MTAGWACLAVVGVAILAFGVVAAMSEGDGLMRTAGVTSVGMGVFGVLITVVPFRRRERWAWFALWVYPVFWVVHLLGQLPPGKDHVHQVVFIVLSLVGLLVPVRDFFSAGSGHQRGGPGQ